ncbi:2'-5' RNA ligase family protein [Microbacterium pygmaeum]|uniref:2'-5' RNA ligase n=1 Tax=Microbacterium pygmaeum TaxID=370764 RepID=A0A1G7ZTH5_9MICO|nr:2'-5' RNA ligase family protein [Microbacterium pygmaeum]SDH11440.1 2'-5' RNA ligase [Microbacterium pygmaeum]
MISIELLLDPVTEARIRDDWARLERAGMSSLGAHRSESNRPHITLVVRPSLDEHVTIRSGERMPLAVALAELIVFAHDDRGVLAWRIELSDELRELHAGVHRALPSGADAPHTAPGEWTPHVTLARRLRLDTLAEARALVGPPITGTGVALRRWDSVAKSVTPL